MKKKSILMVLLMAMFVPLAMNAQSKMLKRSINDSPKLEMKVTPKAMPSNPLLSKMQSTKEAALEELNGRGVRAENNLLTQDFESMTIGTAYSSSGWYAYNAGSGNNWTLNTSSSYANNSSKSAQVQYSSSYAANCYLVSAPFTVSSNMSELTVSLYERVRSSTYAETFEVFFVKASDVTNLAGVASATKYNAIASDSYTNTTYAQQSGTVTNSALAGQSVRVVVHCTSAADKWYLYIDDITVTEKTLEEGCSAPEDFAASNVTTNSVTLSWTETGTSEEWAILYMCDDDEEAQIEYATTNPFTLTGLNPATYYIAEVIPMCGDYDQESEVIEFTTQDLPCPKPSNLNDSNLTPSSATLSWSGEADSYTLQYRAAADNGEATFSDDFEDAWLDDFGDWTTYTQGDAFSGYGWFGYDPQELTTNFPTAYSGSMCAISLSYGNAALNADNYLVTPQVNLGGTLKFWIMSNYSDEYEVLISTRGNAVANFTTTLQAMSAAPASWTEVSIDLSRYEGQQGYIAIHHVFYDGWGLFLDDFGIYPSASGASEWVTVNNVTSPYTIPGLDAETTYEWQIQGDCGTDGQSLWSDISTFTTPSACDAPNSLTTTEITNTSATISWAEALDAYNVRYRKGFVYDFESAEPWTYTNFTPCTTYDGDGGETYYFQSGTFPNQGYVGACIAFQNGFNTNMVSHEGNAFGVMFNQAGATDDWFILPEITIQDGDVFSFWAREITDQYGDEIINVGVYGSTDGTFSSNLVSNYGVSSTEWTELSYDLSSYAGETIRLAINCVSNDIFGLMIDDIFVGNANSNWSDPIAVNGGSYTLEGLDMNSDYVWQVQGVNCDGNGSTTGWSASASFTTLDAILVESIAADNVEVVVGATASITNLVVLPADATNPAVTYTSNDDIVATVTDAGVVTGVAVGTTTITIAATDGSNVSTTIDVTVNGIDVTEITATDVTVVTGETATISYTVAPSNATDQSVTFTSADETIATVADGVVTGVAVGETTITIASVSNPTVTTTINVTVTSNPDAVQFTVVVPATAQPGDVITVEAYMAAPTSGNYDGFTSLGVHLYYDNTAFEHTADPTYGAVGNSCMLKQSSYPSDGVVRVAFVQPAGTPTTVTGLLFSMEFTVLAEAELGSSYSFYVEPMDAANFTCNYNNGEPATRIPYEYTPSEVLVALPYTKDITDYTETGGWYLISSPIGTVNPENVGGMLTNTYDLYYFDQTGDQDGKEWINYKGGDGFNLEVGKGYLYANSGDGNSDNGTVTTLSFSGTPYANSGEVTLTKDDNANFSGWNLIGNPFAETAYIGNRDFYTMKADGTEIIPAETNTIAAMEGIFVIAENNGETLSFSTTAPGKKGASLALNIIQNRGNVIDRAIVRFEEGRTLPKFQIRETSTKLYIPVDGQDYAVVRSEGMGELPVNFKAEKNGTYTMSVSKEEVEFNYLHLIDNLTGADIDLLANPSYSFEAKTTDHANRFKLVFATGSSAQDDDFAFVSNDHLMIYGIEGDAILKVTDLTGRTLSTESFSGSYDKATKLSTGVYMLQLIQGSEVRTQKIVF